MKKQKNILGSWWLVLIILLSGIIIYFIWTSQKKLESIDKKIHQASKNNSQNKTIL